MSSPFGEHVDVPVEQYETGEMYRMVSIDAGYEASDNDIASIVRICNEPLVYRFLFRDRLGGMTYGEEDAREFLAWAQNGWTSGQHMCFLIRDPDGVVATCMDIGELDDSGEAMVGYWSSAFHRGVITNAMDRLAQLAADAGYRKVVSLVEEENLRSLAVLKRAGFSHVGSQEHSLTRLDRPVGVTLKFRRYERAL
jgi:RimJ/RimL family protein N-acetyltransferase